MKAEKIKIVFKAFDHNVLNQVMREVINTVKRTGAVVKGPVPLPVKIKKFTLIKSPHVFKKAKEQFEIRTLKRLLIIIPTPKTIEALMDLDLSSGVGIKIVLDDEKVA